MGTRAGEVHECGALRTWPQVAAEYRRRHGGRMGPTYAQRVAAEALTKIREFLRENPRALEA